MKFSKSALKKGAKSWASGGGTKYSDKKIIGIGKKYVQPKVQAQKDRFNERVAKPYKELAKSKVQHAKNPTWKGEKEQTKQHLKFYKNALRP